MIRTNITACAVLCAVFSLTALSCKKSIDSGWESNYLTPLVSGRMTILDMLPDSITRVNPDQSVDLVFQQNILDYDIAKEAINVPDTSVDYYVSLDSLKLDDRVITQSISLGQVALGLGIPGLYIILNNGNKIPIAPLSGLSSGDDTIDATSFFETATFLHGWLDITIKNGFPVDLTEVIFEIRNASDDAVIVTDTFPYIAAGDQVTSSTDLSGKTVDGTLIANIKNFSTPGTGEDSVMIDTADAVILTMFAHDMELFSATAIFPAQNLVNNAGDVVYDLGGPELTEMKIESGDVVIYVVNTIQDSVHITYNLPYATNEAGEGVFIQTVVPPAPPGESVTVNTTYPLSGYTVDLRGSNHNSFNTFYQEFSAAIDSSGELRTISLADSLHVVYGLQDIVPLELKGYVGQVTQHIADTTSSVAIFDKIVDGTIEFGNIDIDLTIDNGVGVTGNIIINSLKAKNTRTGVEVSLDAPGIVGVPQAVNRALNDPYLHGYSHIDLNTDNSNIDELINILPDQLIYDVDLNVNPNGNEYNYQDFVIADSKIKLDLDMEMPLEFFASNLTLRNDFDVSGGGTSTTEDNGATDGLQSTELTLYATNDFPLDADAKIVFIDDFGTRIDSIDFTSEKINAAALDPGDCRVHTPQETVIKRVVTGTQLQNILNSKSAEMTIHFNTESVPPCSEKVKIYSDYFIEVHLTGNIDYVFSTGNF